MKLNTWSYDTLNGPALPPTPMFKLKQHLDGEVIPLCNANMHDCKFNLDPLILKRPAVGRRTVSVAKSTNCTWEWDSE